MHKINPGLERMQEACDRLGHPENSFKSVHVAGTNGKGSTIAFLGSILHANGYTVGCYISPHLHDIRERITISGQLISESAFIAAYEVVRLACNDLDLSYFEWLTLTAFVYFRDHPVDIVLMETGMGGRWDATNVVTPLVSVITSIDYDHQAYLGETLAQITAEKCGILKPDVPALSAVQPNEAMDVFQIEVGEMGLHAQVVQPLVAEIPLGLPGNHQRQNAALAVAAARIVKDLVTPALSRCPQVLDSRLRGNDEYAALATTCWPGRLEWISKDPPILCDVAHNPSGMRTIADYVQSPSPLVGEGRGEGEITVLLGVMSDKDATGMVTVLSEIADTFYCVTPNTSRALPAEKLAEIVRNVGKKAEVTTVANVKRMWNGPELLVVTGSFYTVGEFCD